MSVNMQASCQCGACHFELPLSAPTDLYHCHCSQCQRQSSSAFGTSAIFPAFPLPLSSQPIGMWFRPTSTEKTTYRYFCKTCGTRLVHAPDEAARKVVQGEKALAGSGEASNVCVKGGCIIGLDWKPAKHIYCGDMVANIVIPEKVEAFVEDDDGPTYNNARGSGVL